jgi:prolyl oligopeptidase
MRIVTADFSKPTPENWVDFIPETENVLSPSTGGGFFFAHYMKDAVSEIKQYDYQGNLIGDVALPGIGTAGGLGGKKEETKLYYTFSNYHTPSSIFVYDPIAKKSSEYWAPKINFDKNNYQSTQVFFASKDGTNDHYA